MAVPYFRVATKVGLLCIGPDSLSKIVRNVKTRKRSSFVFKVIIADFISEEIGLVLCALIRSSGLNTTRSNCYSPLFYVQNVKIRLKSLLQGHATFAIQVLNETCTKKMYYITPVIHLNLNSLIDTWSSYSGACSESFSGPLDTLVNK